MKPSTSEAAARFAGRLLDFDGTVVDTLDLILACFRHTLIQHQGRAPPDPVWLAGMGTPLRHQLRALAHDEAQLDAMYTTYREQAVLRHDALAKIFDGMRECLEALHGRVPMALVTSKARPGVERSFERFQLARYFDVVVTADDVVRAKPAPEPVLSAAASLGVAPGRCLMVGDSPHDVAAGRAAGAATAAAGWGAFDPPTLRAAEPDFWLDQPRALVTLITEADAEKSGRP